MKQLLWMNEMEWNGMKWNEMEWNGMKWNEMEWNGMKWNELLWMKQLLWMNEIEWIISNETGAVNEWNLSNETDATLNENAFHSFTVAREIFLWQLPWNEWCRMHLLVPSEDSPHPLSEAHQTFQDKATTNWNNQTWPTATNIQDHLHNDYYRIKGEID